MLALFKPWRGGETLKDSDQSWDDAFRAYEFSERQHKIMDFFQLRFECNDARDDYNALRKKGIFKTANNQMLDSIDEDEEPGFESGAFDSYEDPEADIVSEISRSELFRITRSKEASVMLKMAGALDVISGSDELIKLDIAMQKGDQYTAKEWKTLLEERRSLILQRRHAQAAKKGVTTQAPTNRYLEPVRIVRREYLEKDFKPESEEDLTLINSIVKKFTLNEEQERAFRIVANHYDYEVRVSFMIGDSRGACPTLPTSAH